MKELIYIGEKFSEAIPPNSSLVVGNKTVKVFEYHNATSDAVLQSVDTATWTAGIYSSVLNVDGQITLGQVQVIDPLEGTTELQHALDMIKEIDAIIEDRAKNAVTQITLNNKTIVNMTLESLTALRNIYVKRAKKLKGSSGIFKSITVFRGK